MSQAKAINRYPLLLPLSGTALLPALDSAVIVCFREKALYTIDQEQEARGEKKYQAGPGACGTMVWWALFSRFLNNSLHAHKGFRAHLLLSPNAWGMPKRSLPCNALHAKSRKSFQPVKDSRKCPASEVGRVSPPVSKGGLGGPKNWKTRAQN